jgi:hypothetical protein
MGGKWVAEGWGNSVRVLEMPLSGAATELREVRIMRVFLTSMPSINLRVPA